eukprot:33653-Eustigmatos_ZCMA.PRE.1
MPRSSTVTDTPSASLRTRTLTGVPGGEYLTALPTRLLKAWNKSRASPKNVFGSSASTHSSIRALG